MTGLNPLRRLSHVSGIYTSLTYAIDYNHILKKQVAKTMHCVSTINTKVIINCKYLNQSNFICSKSREKEFIT